MFGLEKFGKKVKESPILSPAREAQEAERRKERFAAFDEMSNAKISRRGFLKGAAVAAGAMAVGTMLPNEAEAKSKADQALESGKKIEDLHGDIEKGFRPEEIEAMYTKNEIRRSDYYRPDILSSGKDSPFIKEQKRKGVSVKKDVLVVTPEPTPEGILVFQGEIRLDLPVSEEIKSELEKSKQGQNNGKLVRKVVGHGLIAEAETVRGLAWVILPPGTLIANIDGKACIASCLNPITRFEKRPCPPCKN